MVEKDQALWILLELLSCLLDGKTYLHISGQVQYRSVPLKIDIDFH